MDLAVATGQEPALDADLAEAAIAVVAGYPSDAWGSQRFFRREGARGRRRAGLRAAGVAARAPALRSGARRVRRGVDSRRWLR